MTTIVNPFAGRTIQYDWAWHLAHPTLSPIPGTDYKVAAGSLITSPVAGRASDGGMTDGLWAVRFQLPGGDAITIRELARPVGSFPRTVREGEVIGVSGVKDPHIEYDHANGTYSPFENYITRAPKPAPPTAIGKETMQLIYKTIPKTVFANVGELTFDTITNQDEANLTHTINGTATIAVSPANWITILAAVNRRRAQNSLPAIVA